MISIFHGKNYSTTSRGWHLYVRLEKKRTFKTHPKQVFFRYENGPYKYVFLHAFFLICPPRPFQNLSIWQKHTLLFSGMKIDSKIRVFACGFLNLSAMSFPKWPKTHPKRCTRVHCLVLKNNPNYIFWYHFYDIQLQIQVPPHGHASRVTKGPYPDSRPMQ